MKTVSELKTDIDGIIARSFPALSGWRVIVKIVRTGNYVAIMSPRRATRRVVIKISRDDLAAMSESAIRGVLAHELCHVEDFALTPPIRNALRSIGQKLNKKARTIDERATDMRVIAKGYGRNLLDFQQYHDREYEPYGPEDGLTLDEIKRIVIDDDK